MTVIGRAIAASSDSWSSWLVELDDAGWTALDACIGDRVIVESREGDVITGEVAHIGGRYVIALPCRALGRVHVRHPRRAA